MRIISTLALPIRFCFIALAALLAGCGGDDTYITEVIDTSPAPTFAPIVLNKADAIDVTIDSVSVENGVAVSLSVTDQDGLPFVGLQEGDLRFHIAKLIPAENGDASAWQSYINRTESPGDVGTGTEETIQATSERNGTLTNYRDGTYLYTFATDVSAVTDPLAVSWEPNLVHRVAIQVGGGYPPQNPIYTFIPATGATDGFDDRSIVQIESCNECHGQLAFHGGGRIDTQLCVTCHNPGTIDANSGNTVDMKVMIHKIHMGEDLPSVQDGTPYVIYGFRNSAHDYSDVVFPQSINNCTKCHDETDEATAQGGNWHNNPTLEACGSCHDDVDFAMGEEGGHAGGVVTDNTECTTCHAEGRVAGSVQEAHRNLAQEAGALFAYEIIDIVDTAPGEFPQITYRTTDPTSDNAPYALTDPAFTSSASSLVINLAWSTNDYHNQGSGNFPARTVSIDGLDGTANGDGTYTVTSSVAIPAEATGSGAVAIEGHPAGDLDGDGEYTDRIAVTGVVDYFPITDAQTVPRREVVSTEKCQSCHGVRDHLAFHGANRTDTVELCVMCHNPNNTDLAMRPADPDAENNGVNTEAADGLEERSVNFKDMIHGIHAGAMRTEDLVIYGFRNSSHNFSEVHFPGILSDCESCHLEDTYTLPLPNGVLATTVDTGATVNTSSPFGTDDFIPLGAADTPDDDLNIGPIAAACSSCHDGVEAKAHMDLNGSSFEAQQSWFDDGAVVETCQVCHGEGRSADVKAVHASMGN